MAPALDFFALFGLPARFALDAAELERAYRQVQAQVHPDRFASGTAGERRAAMQWAAHANEAFQTLRSPMRRAAYLCERAGVPVEAETNTAMPPAFLMRQLEWRERLDDARRAADADELRELVAAVEAERTGLLASIGQALDRDGDAARAASDVRQLMFVEKFAAEIAAAAEAIEARVRAASA